MPPSVDSSNACLPAGSPVVVSVPPVASGVRGEPIMIDGQAGRLNSGKSILAYGSNRSVVIRNLANDAILPQTPSKLPLLVYRGHQCTVMGVKMAPSGAYMASGDEKGKIRVWAFDHEDHLCKYDGPGLAGPIKDICWDGESKRVALAGGMDSKAECARVIQWDTGVSVGQLSQHIKGRAASVAMKPQRPFRIVTGGGEDFRCYFHKGPPFQRVPPENGIPAEVAHNKGAVNCVRYNCDGSLVASIGSDKAICIYDGKTLELKTRLENIHKLTVYACDWSGDGKHILTASGDGTCKLFEVAADGTKIAEKQQWNAAENQLGKPFDRVPHGGGQLGCTFVNGDIPVSVSLNGQISVLPTNSGGKIKLLTGHVAPIDGLAVDHTNGFFYTGDTDGLLCKWDANTGQPLYRLESPEGNGDLMYVVHGGAVSCLTTMGDGTMISLGWDDKIFITDKAGKVGMNPIALPSQPNAVASGNELAVIVTVGGLVMYKGGQLSSGIISIGYEANCVCVSRDDRTVYVGGNDNKIHVYDSSDGASLKEKHVVENGHLKPVHALAISHDGQKLASADVRDVCVWDLADNYKPLIAKGRWCFHVQRITCIAW